MSRVSELSQVAQHIHKICYKYPWLINTTVTAKDTAADPEQDHLLGNSYADLSICIGFALVIPLIRAVLRKRIFQPYGERVFAGLRKKDEGFKSQPGEEEAWFTKWNESCWKFVVYVVFSSLAFLACYGEDWFTDSRQWWLPCKTFPPCNLWVSRGTLLFYCVETGFYLQAIHFLMYYEVRRKDWAESMAHHVVTSGLLIYSYLLNFTRVGVVTILLHDISDIFLELAKLHNYSKREAMATVWFAVFLVSWVILRVIIFPAYVIRSTLLEPICLVAAELGIEPSPHWEIFNGLLMVLFVLHVYWTYLIARVLVRKMRTGSVADVREDDD